MPHRISVYNSISGFNDNTDYQRIETTWQIGALVKQSADTIGITASDLINTVQQILTSVGVVEVFSSAGIGMLRVTDIRNPYFADDNDQNEASPSFDFTIIHDRALTVAGNNLSSYDLLVDRI